MTTEQLQNLSVESEEIGVEILYIFIKPNGDCSPEVSECQARN